MKLSKPTIYSVDGISGSGKSSGADVIARLMHGIVLDGDTHLFQFIEDRHGLPRGRGLEYFLKYYVNDVDEYVGLLQDSKPQVEERNYDEIKRLSKLRVPPGVIVYDYATSSTMYPWIGEPDAVKIHFTRPQDARRRSIIDREGGNIPAHIPIVLEEGQSRLILPGDADYTYENTHPTLEDHEEAVRRKFCLDREI